MSLVFNVGCVSRNGEMDRFVVIINVMWVCPCSAHNDDNDEMIICWRFLVVTLVIEGILDDSDVASPSTSLANTEHSSLLLILSKTAATELSKLF
jgi:hypothetical protein